jgi:hypothetical protein
MSYSFLNQEKMTTQTGALSKAVDIIQKCINQNQYILGVFCDTRKKVDRSKLPVLKMYQQEVPNLTETKMLGVQLTSNSAGNLTLTRKLRPVKGP